MKKIFALLDTMENVVMQWTAMALMVLLVITVILRYVLHMDLYGIDEPEICVAFWLYFISSAHCSNQRTQITADIVNFICKHQLSKLYIKAGTTLVSALICLIFSFWSFGLVRFAVQEGQKTLVWHIPSASYYIAVVIGLWLMFLYHLRDFLIAAQAIRTGNISFAARLFKED